MVAQAAEIYHTLTIKTQKSGSLPRPCEKQNRCHGLAPWRLTFVATKRVETDWGCHGLEPWRFTVSCFRNRQLVDHSNKRETPRGNRILEDSMAFLIATSVSLHGARPRHLSAFSQWLVPGGIFWELSSPQFCLRIVCFRFDSIINTDW